jgi:hypothetical protein
MVWDGQSRGTLMNVLRLADRNKLVVVYVQPGKGFVDVRTQRDLSALLAELDRQAARRLHADAIAEGLGQGLADQAAWGSDTGPVVVPTQRGQSDLGCPVAGGHSGPRG